jgi:DNA polymerase-4
MSDIHPSLLKRKIIHLDMDCFYAAVEIRDNPSLKGKPIVVGGKPNTRGVVSTCSYEARKYGIHSAMSCASAYQLCPQAIFVHPQMAKYKKVSNQIREIFKQYTEIIEPLSLDEAYLDVTGHDLSVYPATDDVQCPSLTSYLTPKRWSRLTPKRIGTESTVLRSPNSDPIG